MIFGKTFAERCEEVQRNYNEMIFHGIRHFAYLPTKLANGKYVFWDYFWSYYSGGYNSGGLFLWSSSPDDSFPIYKNYMEQDDKHISYTKL